MADRGTFYMSDAHFGADPEKNRLCERSTTRLEPFFKETNLAIDKFAYVGDNVEGWLTAAGFEDRFKNPENIRAFRSVVRNILGDKPPHVVACPGNHEIEIIQGKITGKEAREKDANAVMALDHFLRYVVLGDRQGAVIDTFSGIKETDPNVFTHHGHHLNSPKAVRRALGEISDMQSLEERLKQFNADEGLHAADQKVFQGLQKWFWPVYRLAAKLHLLNVSNAFFLNLMTLKWKMEAQINEIAVGSRRSVKDVWRNALTNDSLLQFDILKRISPDPEHGAVISGHSHMPGIVSNVGKKKGTVVSLGSHVDWKDPKVAIVRETEAGRIIHMAGFSGATDKWTIRDTVKL